MKCCSGGEGSGRGCWGRRWRIGGGSRKDVGSLSAPRGQRDNYADYGKGIQQDAEEQKRKHKNVEHALTTRQ